MTTLARLPPLPQVELALRQATEHFASELRTPGQRAPDWSEFQWSMARAAAVLHGITPLLAGVLRWRGPRPWERFVSLQRIHTAVRQQRLSGLLARIDQQARCAQLALVPLKGAALYRLGLYAGGERPMADLDLLISSADEAAARELLLRLGYLDTSVGWNNREFEPTHTATAVVRKAAASFGEHADRPIRIDLHTRIVERLPMHEADITALMFSPRPQPGLNCYPSIAALFTHLLLHAAGDMVSRSLRLIQLHDLALLAGQMLAPDWTALLTLRQRQSLWWALPPMELLARYYPQTVPVEVLGALRPQCPRSLRAIARRQTLSQVSFANLRIEAFPGIAWSCSLTERVGYILNRVVPSRELLRKRVSVGAQEAWAADADWSQLSHGRRILKWVLRPPPRPPTMHAVRGALEDPAIAPAPLPSAADASPGAARTH
ncbi:MAG: nucleotidyltransferase family protein [Steroidobacteraceae bacterium]